MQTPAGKQPGHLRAAAAKSNMLFTLWHSELNTHSHWIFYFLGFCSLNKHFIFLSAFICSFFSLFLSVPTLLLTLHVPTQWMSRTSPLLPPKPSLQFIFHQSFSFANWQMSSSSFCLPSPLASCLHKLKTSLRVKEALSIQEELCIYLHSMTNQSSHQRLIFAKNNRKQISFIMRRAAL